MDPLPVPSHDDATRWMRDVGILDSLEAVNAGPTGMPGTVRLRSLLEVAEFLIPVANPTAPGESPSQNFVDMRRLAEWTRDTVGDTRLADEMYRMIASRRSYLLMAPELQRLIIGRVSQYWNMIKAGQS
jgi:hypothetical protein